MKTLQQLYMENPILYAKEAEKANRLGKMLTADENGMALIDVPRPQKTEQSVRNERNILLRESDWTQTLDAPLSAEQREQWAEYRQKLRDLPVQDGFPDSVVFPTKP